MSINKDEALRAKDLAENLMKKADFSGARRLVLRAQKLDSSLENISHMIMVCDVHCAAAEKLFGNEMDWYGILQVEQKADDFAIKKQYKKLALLLHPDKNKLPGAESAFKLIGEAQRILSDKDKRSLHDMKRRTVNRPAPAPSYRPQQAPTYQTQPVVRTNNIRNNFTGLRPENQHQQQKPQAQPAACSGLTTFWTSCPFCHMRYEYAREHINKLVNCQKCARQFTTFEVPGRGAPPAKSSGQTHFSFPQQNNVPSQKAYNAGQKHPENSAAYFSRKESFPVSGTKGMDQATFGFPQQQNVSNLNSFNVEQRHRQSSTSYYSVKESVPGARNINGKRKRKNIVESSESSDSESSSESEEDIVIDKNGDVKTGQDLGSVGGHQPRRSVRSKRQVSYKENISDDDDNFVAHNQEGSTENGDAKRAEESGIKKQSCEDDCSSGTLPNGIIRNKKLKEKENGPVGASVGNSGDPEAKKTSHSCDSMKDSTSGDLEEPKILEYADPDFNDFDKMREDCKFVAGQTWAVYDTQDGMPRFYALIRRRFPPPFKLRITWLEADPDEDNEISWFNAELPIGVGKFRFGTTETAVDRLMFSHVVHCEEGGAKVPFRVLPRKGETWALFKNWGINWASDPDSHREFEYEFAEILSEYSEGAGLSVAFLYKVRGFSSVFCRMVKGGSDAFWIRPDELFRFSHSVPSFRLTGEEGEGVPEGSYELDPAALPQNIQETYISVSPNVSAAPVEPTPTSTTNDNRSSALKSNSIAIPKPQFRAFDADVSKEKFQIGQIWSLYGKEDGLPKYYAKIKTVERKAGFKVHVSLLEPKSFPENFIQWRDKNMPICCGTFTVREDKSEMHTDVSAFSHQIDLRSSRRRTELTILPNTSEVWAMYKNWGDHIKVSDLKNWEYNVVEILDVNETHIEVFLLERVDGYVSVFKVAGKQGSEVKMTVPRSELLRFSHQVPLFRLTEERNGTLRNFVELDPKALPRNFFSS